MTDKRFFQVTLTIEERGGKHRLNETRCVGYYADDGKEHITACVGRSMTLPAGVKKLRAKQSAA